MRVAFIPKRAELVHRSIPPQIAVADQSRMSRRAVDRIGS
jgi:hypothetical protein